MEREPLISPSGHPSQRGNTEETLLLDFFFCENGVDESQHILQNFLANFIFLSKYFIYICCHIDIVISHTLSNFFFQKVRAAFLAYYSVETELEGAVACFTCRVRHHGLVGP